MFSTVVRRMSPSVWALGGKYHPPLKDAGVAFEAPALSLRGCLMKRDDSADNSIAKRKPQKINVRPSFTPMPNALCRNACEALWK
jgi:hypothetical protein